MIVLHHVQVACPAGGEIDARRFYGKGLGLTEVEKPVALASRGGAWFRAYDALGAVAAEVHVGVEDPFVPARKAHPAFVVDDLDAVAASVVAAGVSGGRDGLAHLPGLHPLPHPRRRRQPGRGAPGHRNALSSSDVHLVM